MRPKLPLPLSAPISFTSTHNNDNDGDGDGGAFQFPTNKRDKKAIKHSSFVSKIEKSGSKIKKRRRPNKKLVANLESLADALPELEDSESNGAEGGDGEIVVGQAKVRVRGGGLKSMKSRPGAMKRKEKLERMERERFNANLVQLSAGGGTEDRWAALRRHVEGNVERRGEFVGK